VEGKCRCVDGFVAVSDILVDGCVKRDPPTCDATVCTGNEVCVADTTNTAICSCSRESFGAVDCNKPGCTSDKDCQINIANSYCVVNTREKVAPFCSCSPGFTGEKCDISNTCEDSFCSALAANTKCSNEGECKCEPGLRGDNCKDADDNCKVVGLILEDEVSAEEVTKRIAPVAHCDQANILVEGPTKVRTGFAYTITICADENIDETKTTDGLIEEVKKGNTNGLNVNSITEGGLPEENTDEDSEQNASSSVVASLVVVASALFAAL
jgi:hypothetical protein